MTWTPTRYEVYQKYRVLSYRKLERAIAKARSMTKYSPNGVPVWAEGLQGHPFWHYIYDPAYCIVFGDGTIQLTLLATVPTDTATATDTDTDTTEASV